MKYIICFLLAVLLFSCNKDENTGPVTIHKDTVDIEIPASVSRGVIVVNEGQFMKNNGSLAFLYRDSSAIANDIFYSKNQRALGDVVQSAYMVDGNMYVLINNSQKIEVVDPFTFEFKRTITGFTSPRYMAVYANNKAYVSDMYANGIWVVNLESGLITTKIPVNGWPEQMVIKNDKLFVTEMNNGKLYMFDITTDMATDSVSLTKGANSIVIDKNNKLWVLCDGAYNEQKPKLYQIEPSNLDIIKSYEFPLADNPMKLTRDKSGENLYFINNHIFKVNINAGSMPTVPLVSAQASQVFYALSIDPDNSDVYIGDAKDYQSAGTVYRYTANGSFKDSFTAGVIPSYFLFR